MEWKQEEIKGIQPSPRNAHSMTAYNNKLVLFGGHSGINSHIILRQPVFE